MTTEDGRTLIISQIIHDQGESIVKFHRRDGKDRGYNQERPIHLITSNFHAVLFSSLPLFFFFF